MLTKLLFSAPQGDWATYEPLLKTALDEAGIAAEISCAADRPETVDYIIYAPGGGLEDFTPFTGTKAVLSLWAGVDRIVRNPTLTQPLVRLVDPEGLTAGMVEWVTGHVLRRHLAMDRHIVNPDHIWDQTPPPLARDRQVTILGLGQLGAACAQALSALGFYVSGWSRNEKTISGIRCLAGADGLRDALARAEIVVLLLPRTPETDDLLNARTLALLPRGAVILNPGRGPLIDDDALLAALDSGHIAQATLDVFRTEPLPKDHPYWSHPRVTVTPHIAASTRPPSAARAVVRAIAMIEAGQAPPHLVDRAQGY